MKKIKTRIKVENTIFEKINQQKQIKMIKEISKLEEEGKIKWLPWIGKDFAEQGNRILIIGESHYYNPEEKGSFEKHQTKTFTREVISEMAIQRDYYGTRIFQNFHKAIFGNDNFDTEKFYNVISFYNFIQKPMNTNKGRPTYNDFLDSWASFVEVINVLKPTICIFIGTSAADAFNEYVSKNDIKYTAVERIEKIGSNYAKSCSITIDSIDFPIHFIKHTSQYFSWSGWNEYLKRTIPATIEWLKKLVS